MHCILVAHLLPVFVFAQWSQPQNLGIPGADDINPQVCRTWLGLVPTCVVWQSNININWNIFSRAVYGSWIDDTLWSDTCRVTSESADDINPSVAADVGRNCWWCAWQSHRNGNWDIFVSRGDTTGVWGTPVQITTDTEHEWYPSIFAFEDTVWVVWQTNADYGISCAYYDGSDWSPPMTLYSWGSRPKINNRYGRPFVVWHDYYEVYYSEFIDGNWETPQTIAMGADNGHAEIAAHPIHGYWPGGVWIVWEMSDYWNPNIYSTEYDSFSFHHQITVHDSSDVCPSPLFFDIVSKDQWSAPPLIAFVSERDGNSNVYTCLWESQILPLDTDISEDINPVTTCRGSYAWVLWQTDRNSDWDIYASNMCVNSIQELNHECLQKKVLEIMPNPFNQRTEIVYTANQDAGCSGLRIYNSIGGLVQSFSLSAYPPCSRIVWDGKDHFGKQLPNGVYFVNLIYHDVIVTQKVVLAK